MLWRILRRRAFHASLSVRARDPQLAACQCFTNPARWLGNAPRRQLALNSSSFPEGSYISGFAATGDTIYALSTAQGQAGIAVIRISGPSCLEVRETVTSIQHDR